MKTADLKIVQITDTADGGIEMTVEINIGSAKSSAVMFHPSIFSDKVPDEDRQRQLAELAFAEFGPVGLMTATIADALDHYFADED